MKSKQIVLTLGYIAIFCVALYFVFGLLQISGRGLTNMIGGPMIEGMTDKQREKAEKDIEEVNIKLEKDLEGLKEGLGKAFLNADQIDGFDRFQENLITITNYSLEMQKNLLLRQMIDQIKKKGNMNFNDKHIQEQMNKLLTMNNFKKFLEEHENIDV